MAFCCLPSFSPPWYNPLRGAAAKAWTPRPKRRERGPGGVDSAREAVILDDVPDMPGFRTVRAVSVRADMGRHVHGALVIGLVDEGDRLIVFARETALVPQGALFAVAPGQSHACRPLEDVQSYRAVCVDPARAAAMTGHAGPLIFSRAVYFDPDLIEAAEGFFDLLARPGSLLERQSLMAGLLDALAARYAALPPPAPAGNREAARETVERVKAYLRDRLTENPSLAEAAEAARLSPCHLQRLFVETAGVSPLEYLMRERAVLAADLLRQGAGGAEAAQECGFYDQSHFTRHFKRLMGVSPGRFAALNRKKAR